MRRLDRSARFDPAHGLEQLRCLDLADGQPAQPRKHILFEPDQRAGSMAHTDLVKMDRRVPFARDRLEAVDDSFRSACLLGLAGSTWVDALRDEASRLITFVAHRLQIIVWWSRGELNPRPQAIIR